MLELYSTGSNFRLFFIQVGKNFRPETKPKKVNDFGLEKTKIAIVALLAFCAR